MTFKRSLDCFYMPRKNVLERRVRYVSFTGRVSGAEKCMDGAKQDLGVQTYSLMKVGRLFGPELLCRLWQKWKEEKDFPSGSVVGESDPHQQGSSRPKLRLHTILYSYVHPLLFRSLFDQ